MPEPMLAVARARRLLRRFPGAVRRLDRDRPRARCSRSSAPTAPARARSSSPSPASSRSPREAMRFRGEPIGGLPRRRTRRRAASRWCRRAGGSFPSLSVEENLLIGGQLGRPGPWTLNGLRAVPGPGGAPQRAGDRAFRRPAADVRHRPGADVEPATSSSSTRSASASRRWSSRTSTPRFPAIVAAGTGAIIVEQDITRALSVATRVVCLQEGRVSLAGPAGGPRRARRSPPPISGREPWIGNGIVQGVLVGGLYALFAAGLSLDLRRHAARQHRPWRPDRARRLHRARRRAAHRAQPAARRSSSSCR